MTNPVLKEVLFLEDEEFKAELTVEVGTGAKIHFSYVIAVSMSEDHKLLKVDSIVNTNEKEKVISRYFNMNEVVDFFFEFNKREDKDNAN